jgi:FdhD protein
MDKIEIYPVLKIRSGKEETITDAVIKEVPVTFFLNEVELTTILCTPEHIPDLAVGHLYTERIIKSVGDISSINVDVKKSLVRVILKDRGFSIEALREAEARDPGCFSTRSYFRVSGDDLLKKIESDQRIGSADIAGLVRDVQKSSTLYAKTGGVHNAALCKRDKVLFFNEDIGRHNAVDKVIGRCINKNISIDDKIVVTSGRISSAVLQKIVRASIPILISRSAPTSEAIRLSNVFGVTLIGFARGKRFNVYSNIHRIVI